MSELRPRSNGTAVTGIARHGRLRKFGPWGAIGRFIAGLLAVVLVSSVSVAAIASFNIQKSIKVVTIQADTVGPPPNIGAMPGGYNILIVGSDTRAGQKGIGGNDGGGALNDVTMLLHVSQDHTNATAVSFPRDMVVPMPVCPNGGPATGLPINNTLAYGGLACTVLTVQALTGLKIQFAGLITFQGVIEMSNAVGGVPVCVAGTINDTYVGLHLTAGMHTLKGLDALKFLRSRHGVGDGSDLGRISSQQVYLSSLVRTLKSKDTLNNFAKLYGIATAATRNMTLSENFKNLDTLVAIAQSLKDIPLSSINFVQYPGTTGVGGIYAGKVAPIQSQADALFALIKADKPFTIAASTQNRGSVGGTAPKTPTATSTATPTATTAPGKSTVLVGPIGQSAADYTCSKANTN